MPTIAAKPLQKNPILDVAIAIIRNAQQETLVALRGHHQTLAGYWEFPGGKMEPDESAASCIIRELYEELDIHVNNPKPLFIFQYAYSKQSIRFHVFEVTDYEGTAIGKESQPIRWVTASQLYELSLPDANQVLLSSLELPQYYAITPDPSDFTDLDTYLEYILQQQQTYSLSLIQLRAHSLSANDYQHLALTLKNTLAGTQCKLIVNCDLTTAQHLQADGVHLTEERFEQLTQNLDQTPLAWLNSSLVSVACHSVEQQEHINQICMDHPRLINCALASPVLPTVSHPEANPIGWSKFAKWALKSSIPLYALGGMDQSHLPIANINGGYGVAGISAFF